MSDLDSAVVLYSGGLGSWAAAKRAVQRFGPEAVTLLFTDTTDEDPDLYRFLVLSAANVMGVTVQGIPNAEPPEAHEREEAEAWRVRWRELAAQVPRLVWLEDGRGLWALFNARNMVASGQRDTCSEDLKRKLTWRFLKERGGSETTALVLGIDWQEDHRLDNGTGGGVVPRYRKRGWTVWAPMVDKPWLTPPDVRAWVRLEGLPLPRLYSEGFAHNNCGGFCVKAGDGAVLWLLQRRPDLYAYHEGEEAAFNAARPDKPPAAVFTPYVDGSRRPMTMREIRERVEGMTLQLNLFDTGGCGCFVDEPEEVTQ